MPETHLRITENMRFLKDSFGFDPLETRRQVVGLVGLRPGRRVLEVGTGDGWTATILAEAGFEVVGIDLDPDALRSARRQRAHLAPGLYHRMRFRCVDATELPFTTGCFDAVFCYCVIHHMDDCVTAVREMARVCKPSGVVVIADLNTAGLRVARAAMARHGEGHEENACRPSWIATLLAAEGFTAERYDLDFVTAFLVRGLRPHQRPQTCVAKTAACCAMREVRA